MQKIYTLFLLAFIAPVLHAEPSTDEVIAKAREYLGGDSNLAEIKSISYEADFTTAEGDTGTIRIIFQKPMQQRIDMTIGEVGEVTALNDLDGWRKRYDLNNENDKFSMMLLDTAKIRELQANTWENLNFFRGIEKRRGWIENIGPAEVDGEPCTELVFHHPKGIKFTRFFHNETGRLLMTRTHEGSEIREEGEIRVNGVVFPETITMSLEGEMRNKVHFRTVKVNEEFAESLFEVPSFAPGAHRSSSR